MRATFLLAQLSLVHPASPGGINGFHPPLCVGVLAPETLLGGLRSELNPVGEPGIGGDGKAGKRC
jgi:hypothetical protein